MALTDTIERPDVAKKPDKPEKPRDRIDLRVDADFRARLERQSERFDLGLSAYVRQAVIERLERDEGTDPGFDR